MICIIFVVIAVGFLVLIDLVRIIADAVDGDDDNLMKKMLQ